MSKIMSKTFKDHVQGLCDKFYFYGGTVKYNDTVYYRIDKS